MQWWLMRGCLIGGRCENNMEEKMAKTWPVFLPWVLMITDTRIPLSPDPTRLILPNCPLRLVQNVPLSPCGLTPDAEKLYGLCEGLLCSHSPYNSPARDRITSGKQVPGVVWVYVSTFRVWVDGFWLIRPASASLWQLVSLGTHADTWICVYSVWTVQRLVFPLASILYNYICTHVMNL